MNATTVKRNPLEACYADLKSSMQEDARKGRQFFGIDGENRNIIITRRKKQLSIAVNVKK